MTSIKDVAQRAGVGVATVSRVLNETGYVSAETRKKVQDAMEELNYIPNELARNLLHKKSGIVAIIIPKISHPFFAEFVLYAEEELLKNGYKTMICSTYSEQNYEKEYLNMLNRHIVDGIIAGGHTLALEDYASVSRPVVALDRFLGEHIPTVASDHRIGGRLAAEKMIECGCKCVVQVQGALVVDSPSHERHYEFERVMKKHGRQVPFCAAAPFSAAPCFFPYLPEPFCYLRRFLQIHGTQDVQSSGCQYSGFLFPGAFPPASSVSAW